MRGKKGEKHSDPEDPPRRRANKQRGHGTWETDRPPIFVAISRLTGCVRLSVQGHVDGATCRAVVEETVNRDAHLYTDEWQGYNGVTPKLWIGHSTVQHSKDKETGVREWARDDDGDGVREVHCNTCEGFNAAMRTFLRVFRGVHKKFLSRYLAVYEAIVNNKRITGKLIHRMCRRLQPAHSE